MNVGGDFNEISLREGRFTTRVWLNDVNTQFNPFISLVNRLQFDTVTRQLGWQSRFRWITKPGNDIFFVYTHNWIDRNQAFEGGALATASTLNRRGSMKSCGRCASSFRFPRTSSTRVMALLVRSFSFRITVEASLHRCRQELYLATFVVTALIVVVGIFAIWLVFRLV